MSRYCSRKQTDLFSDSSWDTRFVQHPVTISAGKQWGYRKRASCLSRISAWKVNDWHLWTVTYLLLFSILLFDFIEFISNISCPMFKYSNSFKMSKMPEYVINLSLIFFGWEFHWFVYHFPWMKVSLIFLKKHFLKCLIWSTCLILSHL